jgi:predicted transcriptional regulator
MKPETEPPVLLAETGRKALTPKRLALWRAIRDAHPGSVVGLSRLVGRDQKSVHRDLELLVSLGIVALEPQPPGNALKPVSLVSAIRLEVR